MLTLNDFIWFLGTGSAETSPAKLTAFAKQNILRGRYFHSSKTLYNVVFGLNPGRTSSSYIEESEDVLIAVLDKAILQENLNLSSLQTQEYIPVTPLMDIKKYVIAGKTYYTQLDPLLIEYLNSSIELTDILPHNIDFSLHNLRNNTGSNAIANANILTSQTCWVDKIGSIALLDTEIYQEKFKQKFPNNDTCVILRAINCYKGNTPSFSKEEQLVTNLLSGTRFFLYTSQIEVWAGGKKQFVPFLGLAVFGGEKLLLWKNSLELLTTFQRMTSSLEAAKILYPEKYANIIKNHTNDLSQYWPGMKNLVPEKVLQAKAPRIVDVSTLKTETSNNLKPFFLKQTLNKTPEASGFISLEMKVAELVKQEQDLKKEVAEQEAKILKLRTTLVQGNQEIARLQQLLIDSQKALTTTTENFVTYSPKLVRLQNATTTLSANLEPLRLVYNNAIEKYWNEPVNLDIVDTWKEEILIESIVVSSTRTGDVLTLDALRKELSQPVTARAVYISKIVLVTTKPTIIYKDAHKYSLSQCSKFVGGPYRISITNNSTGPIMNISLLDDRSFRGLKLDSYKCGSVWVHPHTPAQGINLGDGDVAAAWTKSTTNIVNACLGEAQPILHNAMTKDLQLASIIYAVKGWLQTANSEDTYGVNIRYFPSADGVKIEKFLNSPNKSIENINTIRSVYDKQFTYTKTIDEKVSVTIILCNTTKLLILTGTGIVVNEKFTITVEQTKTLLFLSEEARNVTQTEKIKELTESGYLLYSTKNNLEKPILEFIQKSASSTPVEEYTPAKKRISDVIDMISRMQASQDAIP